MTDLTPEQANKLRLAGKEVQVFALGEWRRVQYFEYYLGVIRVRFDHGLDGCRTYADGYRYREAP